jgi:hypothetical protein
MNGALEQISNELATLAQAVAANAEQRPLSIAYNQFGMAAMDRKRALDGVPCALPCDMRQATFGFSRHGSKAS